MIRSSALQFIEESVLEILSRISSYHTLHFLSSAMFVLLIRKPAICLPDFSSEF